MLPWFPVSLTNPHLKAFSLLQTTSSFVFTIMTFVFTIKNSVLSATQARALGVIPEVTSPSCFSSPSLSLPHLPIGLSSDLKSILGFNSFCTQLLFSTQPSSHPIHSLQHTRLILVKERPEMLKFMGTQYALQDPFQSGSSPHSPFPAAPTAPHVHLPPGKTSCLTDTPHSSVPSLHRSPWSLSSERFLPSHSYPQLPGPFQLTLSDSDPALFPRGKSSLWSPVPLTEPSIFYALVKTGVKHHFPSQDWEFWELWKESSYIWGFII